ncbi:MAG TPA: peptidyl-prolyl cis-trans isomerase, partial [bacterium]|nr:peptidyl-prolyl cis-trans isomerase [bacterium]
MASPRRALVPSLARRGLALGLLLALPACEPTLQFKAPQVPPDKTAVLLNGEPVSLEEFDTEFRLMAIHYSAVSEGQMRAIKRRLFDQVVDRRLLVQEARKEGVSLTRREWNRDVQQAFREMPDDFLEILKMQGVSEEAWKRKLLQEKLAAKLVDKDVNSLVQITPQEVEDYYWSHLGDYWKPESVHTLHLVVKKHGDLEKALKRLKAGEDFSKVAADLSLADDKSRGGDWGDLPVDRVPAPYLALLRGLKPGEISRPLHDNFGYHLFQLVGFTPRKMQDFAQVRKQIDDSLLKEEQDLRFDQWMADLKRRAVIRINPDLAPV